PCDRVEVGVGDPRNRVVLNADPGRSRSGGQRKHVVGLRAEGPGPQGPRRRSRATASACPSGTRNTFPRPSIVLGVALRRCQSRPDTVKSVAEIRESVRSPPFTTPITCPVELFCSSASLHPVASVSARKTSRLIEKRSPQGHNIRSGRL